MKAKRSIYALTGATVLAVAALGVTGAAQANPAAAVALGMGAFALGVAAANAQPVYYPQSQVIYSERVGSSQPQPVYSQPQVVYQQPQVIYQQPQVVYQQPQVVYAQAPQVVYQQPVYYQPRVVYAAGSSRCMSATVVVTGAMVTGTIAANPANKRAAERAPQGY